jgi:uncharacterized protein YjbI with pentapeptide repeats
MNPPKHNLTLIVKGTWSLAPGALKPVDEQPFTRGDAHREDDPEKVLLYPSDFAYFKPRADLVLKGTCHAPGGKPIDVCRVSFRVGSWSKALAVIGDRQWRGGMFGGHPSAPAPFKSMPVTLENAYGGAGWKYNPVGKGAVDVVSPQGSVRPMPNVEFPDRLIQDPSKGADPAGFGPLAATWPQRMSKTGSYDKKWMAERWPWFPANFDWSYFNAAPPDQQLGGYLKGDEEVAIENLHPKHALLKCVLPGLRVRCFVNERVRAHFALREVPMNLDTLFVDADAEQLVLVWRGVAEVRAPKHPELAHLLVAGEPLKEAARPLAFYVPFLWEALDRKRRAEEGDEEPDEPEEKEPPPEPEEPEPKEEALPEEPPAPPLPPLPAGVAAPPPPPATPPEVTAAQLHALEVKAMLNAQAALAERAMPVPKAIADAAAAPPPAAEPAEPDEPEEPGEAAPDEPPPPTRDEVMARVGRGEPLDDLDLTLMDLSGEKLAGVSFKGAVLEGADLSRCTLGGADFAGCALAHAVLRNADAAKAVFAGADLAEAHLDHANLGEATFEGADLTGASLTGARLTKAVLAGAVLAAADLTDADLSGARCDEADFTEARMHRANFTNASLKNAGLERCWAIALTATEADVTGLHAAEARLHEGRFQRVRGEDTVWESAHLYRCDFTGAVLPRAVFTGAFATEATFNAATLSEAVMREAQLSSARLHRANLLRADLVGTRFAGADLRESNLYDTELRDAVLTGANLAGAFLKMAILPRQ